MLTGVRSYICPESTCTAWKNICISSRRMASERLFYSIAALQVEEDADADVEGTSATGADSSASSQPESEGGKYAPKETFEDGSVMYAASDLEAVDYEAVLAP